MRVLFVALGETEVPAAVALSSRLAETGQAICQIVTWLPRLAGESVRSLERIASTHSTARGSVEATISAYGLGDVSMAADYDRDWHFARVEAKRRHVARVHSALTAVLDEFQPDLIVSSVGGETTRVVAEAISLERGIPTALFNAIPLPRRFVMLKRLSAPFVPYDGADSSFQPARATEDQVLSGALGQPPQVASPAEGLSRLWAQVRGEKSYPPSWVARKAGSVLESRALKAVRPKASHFSPSDKVRILYPLHDERDFQVAVRERHAVPQSALIRYLSSELPPGFHLYLKPHPEHRAAHHSAKWRSVISRPNVHFLPPEIPGKRAIEEADVVLTLASSMGFEAVRAGKSVVCYGSPFYSRRGLTLDVDDPRHIVPAIVRALEFSPEATKADELISTMSAWSWEGSFTPLLLDPTNLDALALSVGDVIDQL